MSDELEDARSKELIRRFSQEDDQAAFEELLTRHDQAVRKYLAGKAPQQDVEDLWQEVWFRVVKRAASYVPQPGARLETWLIKIALNVVRERRDRPVPVADLETPEDVSDLTDAVPEQAEKERRRRAINRAVAKLPDDQRQAVLAHYFAGESVDEIVARTKVPKGTLKSRLKAALKQLPAFFRKEVG